MKKTIIFDEPTLEFMSKIFGMKLTNDNIQQKMKLFLAKNKPTDQQSPSPESMTTEDIQVKSAKLMRRCKEFKDYYLQFGLESQEMISKGCYMILKEAYNTGFGQPPIFLESMIQRVEAKMIETECDYVSINSVLEIIRSTPVIQAKGLKKKGTSVFNDTQTL